MNLGNRAVLYHYLIMYLKWVCVCTDHGLWKNRILV